MIQNFRARQLPSVSLSLRARCQGECITAAAGLREGEGAEETAREPGEVSRLLLGVAPAEERVVDEGVVHVDVDGGRGVDPRDLLDGQHREEYPAAGTPVLLRHLDAHQAELEEAGNQVGTELRRFVHLLDVRLELGLREFADRIPEHGFFFGQGRERRNGGAEVLHGGGLRVRLGLQVEGVYPVAARLQSERPRMTSSATGTRPSGADTCAPCTRSDTATSISWEIRTPSASASSLPMALAGRIRSSTSSGTVTPGHLVGQELGVPKRHQRPDPCHDRNPEALDPPEEPVELGEIEHRLGDRPLRARLHFPRESLELALEVGRGGIHADADDELRRLADRISAGIEPAIEPRHEIGESDAVDVEDRRRLGIGPHLRWIPGDDEQVPDSRRRGAEQIGQHAEEIAVAAGVVHHRLEPHLALDHDRREQRAHPALGPRSIRDVDGVHARRLELPGLLEHRRRVDPLGRHDFHRRDEASLRQLAADVASARRAAPDPGRRRRAPRGDRVHVAGRDALHEPDDGADVVGCGAAAPADEAGTGLDHAARVTGHVLGRRHVHLAVADLAREAGVGLGRDRDGHHARQLFHRLEHAVGPTEQLTPTTSTPMAASSGPKTTGSVP